MDSSVTPPATKTRHRILIIDEVDKTVCGEPSPEALETYSSQFAEQIGAGVRKGKVDVEEVVKEYKNIPGVIDAQPIGIHTLSTNPNDPFYYLDDYWKQWHLNRQC